MKLAVIPARGGSKRIPRKNLREFCGKPMLAHSILSARQSGCFDRILVSSDDPEIAAVARDWGAEAPFLRPAELSNDHAGTLPVVKHAIEWLLHQGDVPELVCCLYATAPFVTAEDLATGLGILQTAGSDYAFTVTRFPSAIQRALRLTSAGRVTMLNPEHRNTRSQDLEQTFHDAGQFYWGRAAAFLAEVPLLSEASAPILLPRYRVQDIDTPDDWRMAELMYRVLQMEASE